jgi:outer membrane protein assembly factor BamA
MRLRTLPGLLPLLAAMALAPARAGAQEPAAPPPPPPPPAAARDSAFERAGDELPAGGVPTDSATRAIREAGDTTTDAEKVAFQGQIPMLLSYYPYVTGASNDGLALAFRIRLWEPAPYEDRVTALSSLSADVGSTIRGSRFAIARFRAPRLSQHWRLNSLLQANREVRYGYFGLGNTIEVNNDLATDAQPFLYRVIRTRYQGQVEVTRRLHGPFQVALLADVTRAIFTALPGASVFRATLNTDQLTETDRSLRLALVYDTRDNEYNTHRGLLFEVGGQLGRGGGDYAERIGETGSGYNRLYAVLRGYYPIREGTVVSARLVGSGLSGTPPLNSRFAIPAWEDEIEVVGGNESQRALDEGRLTGTGALFGNLEVRHDLLNLGDSGAVTIIGFADAGRVFERQKFRLTLSGMEVGGGVGLGVRVLRSTVFALNFATGSDGFNFTIQSGWMF